MTALLIVLVVALAAAFGGVLLALVRRLGELDAKVDRRLEGLDGRLLSTQQSAGETATQAATRGIRERLTPRVSRRLRTSAVTS